ncbi:hypothetical protein M6B38_260280 [Iris pallida]|uniref:RNase H type-1 domain-containing protein n=1 Tax=Iris pallida TaxID=29817 RepID=A0AAX6IF99_IRIPA|nr:hypothetical protein M6B38_260280 [Iris pallida]
MLRFSPEPLSTTGVMETVTVAHLRGQNTPTKMRKTRSSDQLAATGATPTTGYEPACKLRRTRSATFTGQLRETHLPWSSTEGDSSTRESNLQTKKDMVCQCCMMKIDALHDYEGGSSIISTLHEGRVCKTCLILAEYTPGYGNKESLLTQEEHESFTEQMLMGLYRKQLCHSLPEIRVKGKKPRNKLEEHDSTGASSGDLSYKDEDEFDSDDSEEICIPTVQYWFKILTSNQLETNGEEAILALVAQVKELKMSELFNIYTDGFYSKEDRSSRQGAVLRDFHNRPIAAWSSIDSEVESISTLHNELKGFSLGLDMAIKYQVTNFNIYSPSSTVLSLIARRHLIRSCGEQKPCPCSFCILPSAWKKEETIQLLLQILPLIKQLNVLNHDLQFIDKEDNQAAHWMAELGETRKMDLSEIKKHRSLSEIFYTDVFGCFI